MSVVKADLEVAALTQRLRRDRAGALRALDDMFQRGRLPDPPLEGRYRGALITSTIHPWLDAFGRASARLWMPWLGKTFNPAAHVGDNLFSSAGLPLARLFFPFYRGFVADGPGHTRAWRFRAYAGPGALHPSLDVLKIDYDWEANPRFLIRSVLDELVEVEPSFYLGQALLRWRGQHRLAAYFTLVPA